MTLFTPSLWPETVRRPYLRLAGGIVAAPLLMAAALTLFAFVVAGSTELDQQGTRELTIGAAKMFFITLPAFTLTFGLAGVALLWALRQRELLTWLITGAAAGLLLAIGNGLITYGGVAPIQMAVAMVLGLILFFLIRLIAGIRLN